MSLYFRRFYASVPKPDLTTPFTARVASAPHKVNLRRIRKQQLERHSRIPITSKLPDLKLTSTSLTPGEKERYDRLKRLGLLIREDFTEPTEEEWLEQVNAKRARLRGIKTRNVVDPETGKTVQVEDVVGTRIYFPNWILQMIRNTTPPGQPYNPWEATFRAPYSVTKLDVRSYLWAVYGIKCTYIRTQIIPAVFKRNPYGQRMKRKGHKRVIVGLVEPFYYPEAMEDMDRTDRQARQDWLDQVYQHYRFEVARKQNMFQRLTQPYQSRFKLNNTRKDILRRVLERRQAREKAMDEGAAAYLPSPPTTAASTAIDI
ncbi:hypothetical protein Clacol_005426 [Clathrus columnatus]|uniref:Large ribosomal subunit protein uL23m n=1 Tax=Clathrus columnatus TaxID=1419009 RepID=A0AAV5ADF1_9AGAM|nr:hypothetical protein Clacol_005426 [Clathrus columnatus]